MHFSTLSSILCILVYTTLQSRASPAAVVQINEQHETNQSISYQQFAHLTLQGALLMPSDGDRFFNQGGAMGDIQLIYNCPNKTFSRTNIGDRTLAIDVVLVPRREAGFNPGPSKVVLARGLRARKGDGGEKIQVNFVPPISTCGDYRMTITESQIFSNAIVQFSAGAPAVSIHCSPMDDF